MERSHRTDDEEFYIPQLGRVKDLEEFYERAWRWEMYYNLRRYHSTIGRTPYEKLRGYYPLPGGGNDFSDKEIRRDSGKSLFL